jgi:hypothetical protein
MVDERVIDVVCVVWMIQPPTPNPIHQHRTLHTKVTHQRASMSPMLMAKAPGTGSTKIHSPLRVWACVVYVHI